MTSADWKLLPMKQQRNGELYRPLARRSMFNTTTHPPTYAHTHTPQVSDALADT